MEQGSYLMESEHNYPILFLPRRCTPLIMDCESTQNVYINLEINSVDNEGNSMCLYNGLCNIKLTDSRQEEIHEIDFPIETLDEPIIVTETQDPFTHSQVWIDPVRSPNVYNNYKLAEAQEFSIRQETKTSQITVNSHVTHISQDIHLEESYPIDYEHKKFKKAHSKDTSQNNSLEHSNFSIYEDEEFQCGVFLSQLPEEILNEENRERQGRRKIQKNNALKQLMSTDTMTKQSKTILYLGRDLQCAQTLQKININDPAFICEAEDSDCKVVFDNMEIPTRKHYQCGKCNRIFDTMQSFKKHMYISLKSNANRVQKAHSPESNSIVYICKKCGKSLKSQHKLQKHYQGHGNPELECDKCHKVFASKFTLRSHRKIHCRKFKCEHCPRSYTNYEDLKVHNNKSHCSHVCPKCDMIFQNKEALNCHIVDHDGSTTVSFTESFIEDIISEAENSTGPMFEMDTPKNELPNLDVEENMCVLDKDHTMEFGAASGSGSKVKMSEDTNDIDVSNEEIVSINENNVITVMSHELFGLPFNKSKMKKKPKECGECFKRFDRMGDLKRHLIEHVTEDTLATSPVGRDGTLHIQCRLCTTTFKKVDKYKAHLREHANLTMYKCTFCDKTFSDSSNFSKHKKIHSKTYYQCDLCHRKFNSKKMIVQHIDYHIQNAPVPCQFCSKQFYFESMLNKHIKSVHTKEVTTKFKCRFCPMFFKSLKDKWDHEWVVHKVRKEVVDCLLCGSKFRKYVELKKHCFKKHGIQIPSAKNMRI